MTTPDEKVDLIEAIIGLHVMGVATKYRGAVISHHRLCAHCNYELPWAGWESVLVRHQAEVVAERLGLCS